jgi:DnaK suppressor protein
MAAPRVIDWRARCSRDRQERVMSQPTRTSPLSEADLARFQRRLEELREQLLAAERARLANQQEEEPDLGDYADLAQRTIEQEERLRRATLDARLLAEVEHALEKTDAGTYGVSDDSGEPIEIERLEAIPWARRTAAEEERHQILDRAEPPHVTG